MRKLVVVLTGAAVLAVVNYSIYEKEQLLANGRTIFLELAPVDPRSMMQGDYIALRFRIQTEIATKPDLRDGYVVAGVDDRRVATFRRMDNGAPLGADELKLFYRVRTKQAKFGTNAYFFQEGDAGKFSGARYGEARVAKDGQMLLVGLRDEKLAHLGSDR
jgi:uncharacterized membrane-anchored protein